jgi:glycosyltransferase involved in cell wall biosynthesis
MTDTDPILSIIIPTYNCGHPIHECIESILGQSFTQYEIIVMDNCSTDGTLNILNGFASANPRVSLTSEPDKGIYDAMNKGIKKARGAWLYFLGSDDVLYDKDALSRIFLSPVNLMQNIIYANVIFKHSRERYRGKFDLWKLEQINICHQAIFFRKDVFAKLGLFNCRYKVLADYEFNFRWIANRKIKKKYSNEIVATYNETGISFNTVDQPFLDDLAEIKNATFRHASLLEKIRYMLQKQLSQGFYFLLLTPGSFIKRKIFRINKRWYHNAK